MKQKLKLAFPCKSRESNLAKASSVAAKVVQMGLILPGDVKMNPGPVKHISKVWIILTICLSILNCQPLLQPDFLTERFKLSKDKAKNLSVKIPPNMNNGCQLGLIIEIKSDQPHSGDPHNAMDEIRFNVEHPNLPEGREDFMISSNDVEFRWKQILHKLCLTNCENVDKNTLFITAATDITDVKNIAVTSIKGSDHCEQNISKSSSDPWRIPAIISVVIVVLLSCVVAFLCIERMKPKTINNNDSKATKEKLLSVM